MTTPLSFIIPCYNEGQRVAEVVTALRRAYPAAELLVVDDASQEPAAPLLEPLGARVLRHRYNMGNGAAIKTGARHAHGAVLVTLDADGQHDPADVGRLLARL